MHSKPRYLAALLVLFVLAGCSADGRDESAPGARSIQAVATGAKAPAPLAATNPSAKPDPLAAQLPAVRAAVAAQAAPSRSTFLPLPAPAAQPEPCPPPPVPARPPGPPKPPRVPLIAEGAVPLPVAAGARTPKLDAALGKGLWDVHFGSRNFDGPALVGQARAAGLDSIWVRTGGYRQGYYGDALLRTLLEPAHRAGIKVIAWDFPSLSDPAADAERARRALAFSIRGHRLDGFSPDIETTAEGVFATPRRTSYYLSLVRRAAGNRPVITTVPRPTAKRLASYPYRAVAAGSDALAAMVYWSCIEPGRAALTTMDGLMQFGRPVHMIGQAYDMRSEGGRSGLPTAAETWRFVDVSRRLGAMGVSLYQWDTAGVGQKKALAAYPWPRVP